MEPFDEERGVAQSNSGRKRHGGFPIVAVLVVLAFIVVAVALHLAGGAPTHGG